MIIKIINMYPKCAQSFKNWISKNDRFLKVYNDLGKPRPCDITLKNNFNNLNYEAQINLYYNISFNYQPKEIELGSIASEKLFPNNEIENNQNNYILIPNQQKMKMVLNNKNMNNFSFNTSISNSFQLKNTKMNLDDSDKYIYNILDEIEFNKYRNGPFYIKLYVSCINECPIEGKINNYHIIKRLCNLYNDIKINSIILSDTCGSLTDEDFEYIVDICSYFGIPRSTFGLQLYIKKGKEKNAEKIFFKAMDKNIVNFDVSLLNIGGNLTRLDNTNLLPNFSYELYYKFLCNYIINKT